MKKTKSMTVEEARELVSNQSLWPLARDFLWDFSPQIHESWLEGLQTSGFENLNSAPRVKRYILSSLGIEPCFHDFPKEDLSRILLLDANLANLFHVLDGRTIEDGELRTVNLNQTVVNA